MRYEPVISTLLAIAILAAPATAAPQAPVVQNPGFECTEGYYIQEGIRGRIPNGWQAVLLNGNPKYNSTLIKYTGGCNTDQWWWEHLEGHDSWNLFAEDLETPPNPGKPFDAVLYQQVSVTPGTDYSLSGWMLSLCGGSAIPNDCPSGYYMAKMLGIDPTGGTDPQASTVLWVEDRRNFTESGWANLRLGATAQSDVITIFVRINSPFQWHGNHAFIDAISLVEAPQAWFVDPPSTVQGTRALIRWDGALSDDISAIPGGTHELLFDVQYREDGSDWQDWQTDTTDREAEFSVSMGPGSKVFQFRVRARAEQPEGIPGAWPNHRYPGVWTESQPITFTLELPGPERNFIPYLVRSG